MFSYDNVATILFYTFLRRLSAYLLFIEVFLFYSEMCCTIFQNYDEASNINRFFLVYLK